MKRFFYAGCSFTKYLYPTWGDIIAHDKLNYKGYDFACNLGVSGGCNQLIASRLAFGDKKYDFTDQDDIAILWTTLFRESVLTTWSDEPWTRWHAYGNSFSNPMWSEVSKHPYLHNTYNILDRNMTTIHYVNKLYKPFYQGRLGPGHLNGKDYESLKSTDIVKPMKDEQHDIILGEFYNYYNNMDAFTMELPDDHIFYKIFSNHPTLIDHLDHAQKVTDLDSRTIAYFRSFSDKLYESIADITSTTTDFTTIKHLVHDCDLILDYKKNTNIKGFLHDIDYT